MRKRLAVLTALLLLSGCARYWAKPGGTDVSFDTAKARCESDALARYPAVRTFSVTESEMHVPKPDLCVTGVKDGVVCMSNGGQSIPPTFPRSGMSEPARAVFAACMSASGWQPVRDAREGEVVTHGMPRRPGG